MRQQPVSSLTLGVLLGALGFVTASSSDAAPNPSIDRREAFERMKSLVGSWEVEGSESAVTYFLTGRDSALVETFYRDGKAGMSSVYHMDGNDLRVTHYCGAGNQPRMRLSSYDSEEGVLEFLDFVDITNLSAPGAYFTREISIVFQDADHVRITFSGIDEGEEAPASFSLTRK